ncbi:hypothetical protein BH20ACT5_BH20ACT5_12820 [soil metagenome]
MRMHIMVDDDLVQELDRRVGKGQRSAYVARLIRQALEDAARWDDVEQGLGSLEDGGHDWDEDPAEWVRAQRRHDHRRVG